MIKKKCDRCGSPLGTESKKTKERFCGKVIVKGNFNYIDVREMFCDFTLTEDP